MLKAGGAGERIGIKIGVIFSKLPLTPNQWTVLSIIPALLGFAVLVYWHDMPLGLVLFLISGALDIVDGGVARVTSRVSNLGAYLDGMVDRLVEGLLYGGLMLFGLPPFLVGEWSMPMWHWLALLLFVGGAWVSYARAYAHHRGVITEQKELERMGGLLERAERLALVFLGMAVYGFSQILTNYLIVLAALLSILTLIQRVWFVVKNAE